MSEQTDLKFPDLDSFLSQCDGDHDLVLFEATGHASMIMGCG